MTSVSRVNCDPIVMKPGDAHDVALYKRTDWFSFMGFARMHVSVSGGPIHEPYTELIQLFTDGWWDDFESWTVYRHEEDAIAGGKVVHKVWKIDRDKKRFRALGAKEAPRAWWDEPNVVESEFEVPAKWISDLARRLGRINVPPICEGPSSDKITTTFRLRLWHGDQESEFKWGKYRPKRWTALFELFDGLEKELREKARRAARKTPPRRR